MRILAAGSFFSCIKFCHIEKQTGHPATHLLAYNWKHDHSGNKAYHLTKETVIHVVSKRVQSPASGIITKIAQPGVCLEALGLPYTFLDS